MPDPLPADRIPARTDADARKRYLGFLQKSLSAVHPTAIWLVSPVGEGMHSAFTVPEIVGLSGPRGEVYLRATQRFEYGDHPVYGDRKVVTAAYAYTLAEEPDLRGELFSWQWHPGDWPDPHLHVSADRKLHVPTGRVAFEQVLLFTITDLKIEAAKGDEAFDVLNESLRRFRAFRTWGD